jgi:hypothetical protein
LHFKTSSAFLTIYQPVFWIERILKLAAYFTQKGEEEKNLIFHQNIWRRAVSSKGISSKVILSSVIMNT